MNATQPRRCALGLLSGEYDGNMRTICEVLGQVKSPVTLRWAHEMDDRSGQFIWSGWNPKDYINAYHRVIDICRSVAPKTDRHVVALG